MRVDFEHDNMSEEEMIREIKLLNDKLLHAEQVKTDFLSNIKNEINNPMTSILGLLKMIITSPNDHEGNQKKARLIYNEVHNLNFQIRNVFIAAEIEAGNANLEVTQVNMHKLVSDIIHSFENQFEKKNISIDWKQGAHKIFASDKEMVHLIIANLLSNAIKFSHHDASILLELGVDDNGNLTILCQDFGVGIDEGRLQEIFDRFKQLDSGTKKEFAGHGLGLSIVHSLVDLLDGELFIDSKVDVGTSFKVVVPPATLYESDMEFYGDDDAIFFDSDDSNEEVF